MLGDNLLQSSFPDISGCNVFERRGVIERLEAWSEVQLNSERIAVEAGPEVDLVFNTYLARAMRMCGRRWGERRETVFCEVCCHSIDYR